MNRACLAVLSALAASGFTVWAAEFPLELKRVDAQWVRSLGGGWGSHGQVESPKSAQIKKEPAAVSAQPLYGQFYGGVGQMGFRLDESQGTGKGYDRLVIDLNHNGDLSDDPVLTRDEKAPKTVVATREYCSFGPTEVASVNLGPWHPSLCAELQLYNKSQIGKATGNQQYYYGYVRLFAAWYLETTVELEGVKQRIALRDGDCNLHLGDRATASKMWRRPGEEPTWYLSGRDFVLRDRDGSGRYPREGAEMLSTIIYFGAKPYAMAISPDFKTLKLEPYAGALAELTFNGGVSDVVLGRETGEDQWEALTPEIKDGKAVAPAGAYRVASCKVTKKAADGSAYHIESSDVGNRITKVEAGKSVLLACGAPLDLKVVAKKVKGRDAEARNSGGARSLFGAGSADEPTVIEMNVTIQGSGGEAYTSFSKTQSDGKGEASLDPPWFKAVDASGKQVATGRFEFG